MGNYLAGAMFHDVAVIPMVNMFLFFLAGVTAGLRSPSSVACGLAGRANTARFGHAKPQAA